MRPPRKDTPCGIALLSKLNSRKKTIETLSKQSGVSTSTCKRILQELVANGEALAIPQWRVVNYVTGEKYLATEVNSLKNERSAGNGPTLYVRSQR